MQTQNTTIMKQVLISLVTVTTTKTTEEHAWLLVKTLLNQLREDYRFLRSVEVVDSRFIENAFSDLESGKKPPYIISFMEEIDDIDPQKIGAAIQKLIDILKKSLGKKAGYFFIQELKDTLGTNYHTILKQMGVDLRLLELQDEMFGLSTEQYSIRDEGKQNIAFIEKK